MSLSKKKSCTDLAARNKGNDLEPLEVRRDLILQRYRGFAWRQSAVSSWRVATRQCGDLSSRSLEFSSWRSASSGSQLNRSSKGLRHPRDSRLKRAGQDTLVLVNCAEDDDTLRSLARSSRRPASRCAAHHSTLANSRFSRSQVATHAAARQNLSSVTWRRRVEGKTSGNVGQ